MHPKQFKELSPDELCRAIEATHHCRAHFEYWQRVEMAYGAVWWMGGVGIFRLDGHPEASHCYAWSWPVTDTDRQIQAVLEAAPITNAHDAVRATLSHIGQPAVCPP